LDIIEVYLKVLIDLANLYCCCFSPLGVFGTLYVCFQVIKHSRKTIPDFPSRLVKYVAIAIFILLACVFVLGRLL